jgi:hypothetical protein
MSHPDDENLPPLPPAPPSALETAVQDHPMAALLAATLVGVLLAKTVF